MKKIIQWKKAYIDEDGLTCIPVKTKGKKKFKCDDCGKKVREVFTINLNELLSKRELCRGCYVKTPESLEILLEMCGQEDIIDTLSENRITTVEQLARLEGVPKGEGEGKPRQDIEDFEFNKKEDDIVDENTNSFETFGEAIKEFEKETGKSIFNIDKEVEGQESVHIFIVCDKCNENLDVGIESEFAKIPFESSWSCKCGNYIKTKWNGKELEYL